MEMVGQCAYVRACVCAAVCDLIRTLCTYAGGMCFRAGPAFLPANACPKAAAAVVVVVSRI